MILFKLMKPIDLLRGLSPPRSLYRARVCFYIYCISDSFILQFVCKVNAENYSDHASSAPQQNKKVLSPCFQYTNSVKQKVVSVQSGVGAVSGLFYPCFTT